MREDLENEVLHFLRDFVVVCYGHISVSVKQQ
jgi:hypothetical protein